MPWQHMLHPSKRYYEDGPDTVKTVSWMIQLNQVGLPFYGKPTRQVVDNWLQKES